MIAFLEFAGTLGIVCAGVVSLLLGAAVVALAIAARHPLDEKF